MLGWSAMAEEGPTVYVRAHRVFILRAYFVCSPPATVDFEGPYQHDRRRYLPLVHTRTSVYTLVQDLPQLTRHGMVHWWSTARAGRVIFWIDSIDADHETASKHFLKRLSALLDAPYFYLTIMCSVDVQGDTVGINRA
jgi:hypothetical protein